MGYAVRAATDGTRTLEDCGERAKLLAVREALYVGPERVGGERERAVAGARKRAREAAAWENRPCSPVLFAEAAGAGGTTKAAAAAANASANASGFVKPGEDLHRRLETQLSQARQFYDAKAAVHLDDVAEDVSAKARLVSAHKATALGSLMLPIRRRNPLDEWTPREIAVFESALCLYGKTFHLIAELLPGKSTKDVVEFYYHWKHTPHYAPWKKTFKAVDLEDM